MNEQKKQMAVKYFSLLGEKNGYKWESSLNKIFSPGCYAVEIEHNSSEVGLPVEYCGNEHYIVGNLVVTDSGTNGPKQNNRLTGQVLVFTSRKSNDTRIFTRTHAGGAWSTWRAVAEAGAFDKITTTDELVSTVLSLKSNVDVLNGEGAGSVAQVAEEVAAIEERTSNNSMAIENILNGGDIVPLARDIYSVQGKEGTATILKRTTAGHTSVNDGVARLKCVGGGVLKNLVDGTFASGWEIANGVFDVNNSVARITSDSSGVLRFSGAKLLDLVEIEGHKYYMSCAIRCESDPEGSVLFGNMNGSAIGAVNQNIVIETTSWTLASLLYTSNASHDYQGCCIGDKRATKSAIYAKSPIYIDLTEMFSAGKEPTKEECDRMFAGVGALPKGISIAKPTAFKSVGYNQCDVSKAMPNKTVADGVITDGANYLVPMPCLPCKTGTGENNGYVIATGEGDTWSEDAITAVYYTPLNPAEVTGELYLQELAPESCAHCNGTHNVYVPACEGWLLIETASIDKLCAHFAWSGDRAVTDYEEYTDSSIEMPVIPEMSEWGLAGVGTSTNDTIDLERGVYIKKIGSVDMGTLNWTYASESGKNRFLSSIISDMRKRAYNVLPRIICESFVRVMNSSLTSGYAVDNSIWQHADYQNRVVVDAPSYTDAASFKAAMQGVMLYYELAEYEEYPIKQRLAPAYIASDYGTEEFAGSEVPLNGNVLFYQRSLVSETRNFLDRLYSQFATTDACVVADRLAALLQQSEEPLATGE